MKLLLGIGHRFRSDDGLGPYVVRQINERKFDGIVARELNGDFTNIIELLKNYQELIVVDASIAGQPLGSYQVIDYIKDGLSVDWAQSSTHGLGIAEGLQLAAALGVLPEKVTVYAVEAGNFDPGNQLSPEVLEAANKIILEIEKKSRKASTHNA
jgi:hydrogenase maturation protease